MLSPHLYKIKGELVRSAVKYVPELGFAGALGQAIKESPRKTDINDAVISTLFDRGFAIAVVEHLAQQSNAAAFKEMEARYTKGAILKSIEENEEAFLRKRLILPSAQSVVIKAMCTKMEYLHPLVSQWPEAVALEYKASNFPFAMLCAAEFIDTVAFYMERAENLAKLLEPARQVLQSKSMVSFIPVENSTQSNKEFLETFIRGIPLSSGPHMGSSSFDLTWYQRRAKVGVVYMAAMSSFLGDESPRFIETRQLTQELASTIV